MAMTVPRPNRCPQKLRRVYVSYGLRPKCLCLRQVSDHYLRSDVRYGGSQTGNGVQSEPLAVASRRIFQQRPQKGLAMIDLDDEPDQDKRIDKLRSALEELGGGPSQHPELSADLQEAFLKHILAFETAEPTTLLQWLEHAGLDVPPPD